jgi:trimeric autotransporter adhesin
MANPTTNYGWPMPTSTDLVTDLPADFDAFGQPVDTTLKALNPETTLGDISFRSATLNTNTRLGIGTDGQVLAVSGGVPAWTTTADVTPLTTKGDLFTFTTEDARLPVGTDGYTLVADSVEATGLKWAAPAGASFAGVSLYNATGNISVASTTAVALTWDNEKFDIGGYHAASSSDIVIPAGKAGYYLITFNFTFSANSTGQRIGYITFGGGANNCATTLEATSSNEFQATLSIVRYCAVADTIAGRVYQNSGSSLSIRSIGTSTNYAGNSTSLSAIFLGA